MLRRVTDFRILAITALVLLVAGTAPADSERHPVPHDGRTEDEQDEAQSREQAEFAAQREIEAQMMSIDEDVRQLRMQQIELEAAMERAELDSEHERVVDVQRQLVEIEYQLQRRQLDMERIQISHQRESERRELMRMTDRLDYVAGWKDVAFDPPQAVMMATQAIVELHVGSGQADLAAKRLEGLLEKIREPGCRTAIRFALKDIYLEMDQPDKAGTHMLETIVENAHTIYSEDHE